MYTLLLNELYRVSMVCIDRLYIAMGQPDPAINMYKKHRQVTTPTCDHMILHTIFSMIT